MAFLLKPTTCQQVVAILPAAGSQVCRNSATQQPININNGTPRILWTQHSSTKPPCRPHHRQEGLLFWHFLSNWAAQIAYRCVRHRSCLGQRADRPKEACGHDWCVLPNSAHSLHRKMANYRINPTLHNNDTACSLELVNDKCYVCQSQIMYGS